MNIHPLFVHFPIGILILYVGIELFRLRIITRLPYYFQLRAILVIIGTAASYVTAFTGDIAEEIKTAADPTLTSLIETHAMYAGITITIFSILAGSYLFEWMRRRGILRSITNISIFHTITKYVLRYAILFAGAGLIAITITGGLGASIVYGPQADPIVSVIYALFSGQ